VRKLFKVLIVVAIILIAVTVAVSITVVAWMGSLTIGPLDIGELTLTDLDFTVGDASTGRITVQVTNTETRDLAVAFVRVNRETVSNWTSKTSNTVPTGASETFTITHAIATGITYNIKLLHLDGTMIGNYTATA
jgi:hypothetical protein